MVEYGLVLFFSWVARSHLLRTVAALLSEVTVTPKKVFAHIKINNKKNTCIAM